MLAFLAIVADDDLRKGIIEPSYILCTKDVETASRTDLIVKRANEMGDCSKLLVNSLSEYDELIHFLSNYRTRERVSDDIPNKLTKKFCPIGALFWFPCDKYGNQDESQPPLFIKRVPDRRFPRDGTKAILEAERKAKKRFARCLSHDPSMTEMLPIAKREYEENKTNEYERYRRKRREEQQYADLCTGSKYAGRSTKILQ